MFVNIIRRERQVDLEQACRRATEARLMMMMLNIK
jgi:hypothetical protein